MKYTNVYALFLMSVFLTSFGSSGFYVVMLCVIEGAKGAMRTGFSLKGDSLVYRISRIAGPPPLSVIDEKEIPCGSIKLKNFELRKCTIIP